MLFNNNNSIRSSDILYNTNFNNAFFQYLLFFLFEQIININYSMLMLCSAVSTAFNNWK